MGLFGRNKKEESTAVTPVESSSTAISNEVEKNLANTFSLVLQQINGPHMQKVNENNTVRNTLDNYIDVLMERFNKIDDSTPEGAEEKAKVKEDLEVNLKAIRTRMDLLVQSELANHKVIVDNNQTAQTFANLINSCKSVSKSGMTVPEGLSSKNNEDEEVDVTPSIGIRKNGTVEYIND